MPVIAFAIVDLALLLVTAGLGLASLLAWVRRRSAGFPTARIVAHVSLQLMGIGCWTAFVLTGGVPLAWIAFAVITAGQVLGDLLMFASYRARHPDAAGAGYRAVSGDVLSFRRPVPALHALVGALAWFGMLAICVVATVLAQVYFPGEMEAIAGVDQGGSLFFDHRDPAMAARLGISRVD